MEMYRNKDESMDYFEKHGKFPLPMQPAPRKPRNMITFGKKFLMDSLDGFLKILDGFLMDS